MGVDSLMQFVATIAATDAETGKAVVLQVWRGGGQTEVCRPGGSRMVRLAQGNYRDIEGNEFLTDDPDAP